MMNEKKRYFTDVVMHVSGTVLELRKLVSRKIVTHWQTIGIRKEICFVAQPSFFCLGFEMLSKISQLCAAGLTLVLIPLMRELIKVLENLT